MPTVTQYGPSRVTRRAVRGARAQELPSSAFTLGTLGKGVGALGEGISLMSQRIDTTTAEDALVKFEREKNNLFFDPESGYFNTQGRDAYDQSRTANESLQKMMKQHADAIESEDARRMFMKTAEAHVTRGQQDIMRHASKGFQVWEIGVADAQVENSIENAALVWNDEDKMKVNLTSGELSVINKAKMEGVGAEVINERLQTFRSSFTQSAVLAATQKSSEEGQKLLDKHRKMIEGDDLVNIEAKITAKKKAEETQRIAGQAVLTAGNLNQTYGEDLQSMLDEVAKIEDPAEQQATRKEVMAQFKAFDRARSEEQGQIYESVESYLEAGNTLEMARVQYAEEWDKMSKAQRDKLTSGKTVETDWPKYSELVTLPKEKLALVKPADHFHKLAPAERQKLINAVNAARKPTGGKASIDAQVGRTRNQQVSLTVEQIFGAKKKWNAEEKAQVNAFYSMLDVESERRESELGRPLSSEEFTALLADFTRKVVIEKPWYKLGDVELNLTDIPAEDAQELSKFLRQNNIPITADNLIKAYQQAQ